MGQTALAEAHVASPTDEAFERLYREHVATVYRYALGVLRNPADAEDVAQSTFTNAYRAISGGEWPDKPENWLITIAHNECRQRFRRLGRRAIEVPLDHEVAERSSSYGEADTGAAIEDVLDALAELPFNQRAAIVLREVSGRSAAEIAEFLGTSVASVDMLIFRARRTLRTQFAAVKALALVPLPRSLFSFGGASAAKAGAVAGGLGVAGKVAAVLTAGAVAAGAGYTGVKVRDQRDSRAPSQQRVEVPKAPAAKPPAAEPPVRAQRGPVEEVRGNREAPPATGEVLPAPTELPTPPPEEAGGPAAAPVPAPPALVPPAAVPSVPSPPAVRPPALPIPPAPEPPAVPPVEPPAPPEVAVPPPPSLPVEPPAVTVPQVLPETPTTPIQLPVP